MLWLYLRLCALLFALIFHWNSWVECIYICAMIISAKI